VKRWIVTGCNGYLGRELCLGLSARAPTVGVLRQNREPGILPSHGIKCVTYEQLVSTLGVGDVLVHCAGRTGFSGTREEFESVNVTWTTQLLKQAQDQQCEAFIYVSSVAAMGYRRRKTSQPLTETDAPNLADGNLYGHSKLRAEERLKVQGDCGGTRLLVLRPGLIYGRRPYEIPPGNSHVGWRKGQKAVSGNQRIPLIYIDNFCDAVAAVGEQGNATGTFLVVDREQPTLRQLNELKIQLRLMHQHPWYTGLAIHRAVCLRAALIRKLKRIPSRASPSTAEAMRHFYCRQLSYSTEALRRTTGWEQNVSLVEGWKRVAEVSQAPSAGNSPC